MAIPTTYSEATLKAYLHTVLGPVAVTLGWTVAGGNYDEAANEAIAACGVDDVAAITGRDSLRRLRALARREVWRAVMGATVSHYNLSTDGARRDRAQIHEQARAMFQMADAECAAFDDAYEVAAERVAFDDPYLPPERA